MFLKHLSELSQDTVGDYNRLTHRLTPGRQIRRAKQKATLLMDKHIKTCIDTFAAGVYSRYDFLSAVSHPTLQTTYRPDNWKTSAAVSDNDETETYDVEEH